jgi:hypothetical protein
MNPTMKNVGTPQKIDAAGNFQAMDREPAIQTATSSNLEQKINPLVDAPKALDYNNALEGTLQNKVVSNLDRTVQEGYDSGYLKNLADAGLDPLKEAYDVAMSKADADWNRKGMRASGFEFEDKFGSQDDSVTTRFLKEAANVSRDVGLKGAEAAREDRFKNANLQDQSLTQGLGLSQAQNQNQAGRLASDVDRSLAEKGLTKDVILADKDLAVRGIDLLQNQDQTNEDSKQFWAKNLQDVGQQNLENNLAFTAADNEAANSGASNAARLAQLQQEGDKFNSSQALEGAGMLLDQDQTNEAAKQFWAKNLQDLGQQNISNRLDYTQATNQAEAEQAANAAKVAGLLQNQGQFDQNTRLDWANLSQDAAAQDEAARQAWAKQDLELADFNRQGVEDQVKLGMSADQQEEANRQWWGNFQQGQANTDDEAMMGRWKELTDLAQWGGERDDKAKQFDLTNQLNYDQLNQETKQAGIQNLINFFNAQGTSASSAQDAFLAALKAGQGNAASTDANTANMAAWLGDLFKTGTNTTTKPGGTAYMVPKTSNVA